MTIWYGLDIYYDKSLEIFFSSMECNESNVVFACWITDKYPISFGKVNDWEIIYWNINTLSLSIKNVYRGAERESFYKILCWNE